jgi:UbiD family decarboxylase
MNLRDFLNRLENENRLIRIKKEVTAEYEIANVINTLGEQPVIFENVKGYDFPVFGGITSSRDVIATGLDTTKEKLLFKLVDALRNPKEPKIVDMAPCHEVCLHNKGSGYRKKRKLSQAHAAWEEQVLSSPNSKKTNSDYL